MNWFWEILKVALRVAVFMIGIITFFCGPAIEKSEENPDNWDLNAKFHKFTDKKAIIFRILGLVIAYFGWKWVFAMESPLKTNGITRFVFGFGFVLALFESLILIIFGEKFMRKMKDFQEMIDLEVMPARLWGLTFLITSLVFLAWIVE